MTYKVSLFMCCESDDSWGQLHSIDLFHHRVIVKYPVLTRLKVDIYRFDKDSTRESILMMVQLEAHLSVWRKLMMMRAIKKDSRSSNSLTSEYFSMVIYSFDLRLLLPIFGAWLTWSHLLILFDVCLFEMRG